MDSANGEPIYGFGEKEGECGFARHAYWYQRFLVFVVDEFRIKELIHFVKKSIRNFFFSQIAPTF